MKDSNNKHKLRRCRERTYKYFAFEPQHCQHDIILKSEVMVLCLSIIYKE